MYQKKLMDIEIADFKRRFHNQFKIDLTIVYPAKDVLGGISLQNLEDIGNEIIIGKRKYNEYNIRSKSRIRELILIRICIFKVATEFGYGPSEIGKYFGFDHATVIHSRNKVDKNLDNFDIQVMLNTIRNECKNKYGDERNIRPDN